MDQLKEKLKPNPRITAGWLSKLSFWWLMPLLRKGSKEDLTTDDLYEVEASDASAVLCEKMERYWEEERARAAKKKGGKASFAWALARCFGCRYFAVGLLAAVEECILRIAQPIFLGFLIRSLSGYPGLDERWISWAFASGIVLCSLIYILTHHPFFFGIQRIGMQIRIGSCALLFRKSLRLSKAALANTTVGQMVNLLSNDVNRFDTSVIFLNYLWVGPLQLIIVTGILWYTLGVACFAGLIVIVLFIPLQSLMGKVFSRLRLKTAKRTDLRVRVMNEIVNAMRVIKMYAWEYPFADLVKKYRKSEIDVVMRTNYCRAVNMSLFFTSAKLVVFLALLTYVLTGNVLTAEKVFVTSALINNVRLVMTLFFPMAISMGSETLISCQRLQEFFELEELGDSHRVDHVEDIGPNETAGVEIKGLTAKWTEEGAVPTLSDITASVRAGELLAVVGPVGAGKGSLLHCILGELPAEQGTVVVRGKVAYASQEPWLFSGSVRQNILFGKAYDEKKYGEVIKVCGLEADLEQLPDGDRSMVGERGTSLSGGQKARVNLARAVYMEGDVVLLDDPLSAVDTVVGRHLFRRCIRTHLRSKAVILVTHQLQYIRAADNILVLKEGRCEALGSYNQLVNKGLDFTSLLQEEKEDSSLAGSITVHPAHVTHMNIVNSIRRGSELSRGGSFRSIGGGSLKRHHDETPLFGSALSIAGSVQSVDAGCTEIEKEAPKKQLENEKQQPDGKKYNEMRSTGSVSGKIYLKYFLSAGHWILCIILLVSSIVTQVLFSGTDWWLSYWTNGEQLRGYDDSDYANMTYNSTEFPPDPTLPPGYLDTSTNVIVYTSLVGSLFILSLSRTVLFFVMCMRSSRRLHNNMFSAVIRVPIQYFDTHPIGQILNRFSKDLGQIDEQLPTCFWDFFEISFNILGIIAVISLVNPYLLIPTVILAGIFVCLRRFYLSSARDIKRLEGITRSPVFSHLSTSLHGLTTIRAFRAQHSFVKDFDDIQDVHSSAWFLFICTTRWFGIYLDCLSCLYIAIVTYSFLGNTESLGGDVGLAISSAMSLSGMFQWGVRQSAEVENQMTSVERVIEFSKLEPEAPLTTEEDKKLPKNWPRSGSIQFIDVSLQYEENKPPVLKNLNFSLAPGEKIGIVGRTGAGKSSLISCLFRLTEPKGKIIIDGADAGSLGLHTLRKNISIIPQDPTLFNDTFRKNLDPFSEHTDEKLWQALQEVQLKDAVHESAGGLEHVVSEGGSNLSVGQRQLVCLARAILSDNPILLMDEATANVDPKTDELIQRTIRQKFVKCTVLTVAHRLHTIMDSTRVMVLNAGYLKEFDAPHVLLKDKNSLFSHLVQQAGPATASHLRNLAMTAFRDRNEGSDVSIPSPEKIPTSLIQSSDEGSMETNLSQPVVCHLASKESLSNEDVDSSSMTDNKNFGAVSVSNCTSPSSNSEQNILDLGSRSDELDSDVIQSYKKCNELVSDDEHADPGSKSIDIKDTLETNVSTSKDSIEEHTKF